MVVRRREQPRAPENTLRTGADGVGDATPLTGPIVAGQTLHLEVFGPLSLAPFGPKASYPTDDRAFRVELSSDQGSFVMTGTCGEPGWVMRVPPLFRHHSCRRLVAPRMATASSSGR